MQWLAGSRILKTLHALIKTTGPIAKIPLEAVVTHESHFMAMARSHSKTAHVAARSS